jgi:riboflavin synthase
MFTGIIADMGTVRLVTRKGQDARIEIDTALDLSDLKIGDSMSVNGVCLTITTLTGRTFAADVSAETLARTTLNRFRAGSRVNLEKALRPSDFMGGHIVLGHVDGTGKIVEKTVKSDSVLFAFDVDPGLDRYIVEKGSVAVDGISLTVNRCEKNRFYVSMIPLTAEKTTLGLVKAGERVNIETDILGKYVYKLLQPGGRIDTEFLAEHGFIK